MTIKENIEETTATKPFLSIVLTVLKLPHLVPLTLESILSQTEKAFEIIIVEKGLTEKEIQTFKEYAPKNIRIFSCRSSLSSFMKNQGFCNAKGKYVQFVKPGNIFLSKHVLSYLVEKAEKKNFPDFFYCSFLSREGDVPEVKKHGFSYKSLVRGDMPARLESCFFEKKVLTRLKGFDRRYLYQDEFDFFSRLFLAKKFNHVFVNRVLMDYEIEKKTTKTVLQYGWDMARVIFHHFGFGKALFWCLFCKKFRLIRIWIKAFQESLWKR